MCVGRRLMQAKSDKSLLSKDVIASLELLNRLWQRANVDNDNDHREIFSGFIFTDAKTNLSSFNYIIQKKELRKERKKPTELDE